MKTLPRLFLVICVVFCTLGNSGCTTTDTIIAAEGPRAAELGKAKDEQIAALEKKVANEKAQREAERAEAAKAASSVRGILKANSYQPKGKPTEAVEQEASVALTRLPPEDAGETVKSLERAIQMIEGERDKALADYAGARKESETKQAEIAARDRELAKRDTEINARGTKIAELTDAAKIEREKHADDIKSALAKKDAEFADYKKAEAEKERRWLVNATRIAALGLVVIGAVALAAFKMVGIGSGIAGAGVLVGLISIGIETLTSQPWWPALCGSVFVLVAGASVYGVYRLWVKHQLGVKKTQAIQDMIDEATTKGDTKAVEELKAHLTYRMGDKKSFWGKKQAEEVVALGLVNPEGEAALKASDEGKS